MKPNRPPAKKNPGRVMISKMVVKKQKILTEGEVVTLFEPDGIIDLLSDANKALGRLFRTHCLYTKTRRRTGDEMKGFGSDGESTRTVDLSDR